MATMYQYRNRSPSFVHFAQKNENYDEAQIAFQVRDIRWRRWSRVGDDRGAGVQNEEFITETFAEFQNTVPQ